MISEKLTTKRTKSEPGPKWRGPRNVPKNVRAAERKRVATAQKVTRRAYNGQ